jgi:exopolysaccharide production protein ExoQ
MFRWHRLAAYFFLAQTIGAFGVLSRLYYGEFRGGFAQTTALGTFLNLVWISAALFFFATGVRKNGRLNKGASWLILMSLMFLLSTLWSIDPATTVRRSVLYIIFSLGSIGLSVSLTSEEFVDRLEMICLISAVSSLVLLILSPNNALMLGDFPQLLDGSHDLRGIFTHKTVLGEVMVVGALTNAHQIRKTLNTWNLMKAGIFVYVSLLSHSTTATTIIIGIYGTSLIFALRRSNGPVRALGSVLTILVTPLAIGGFLLHDDILVMLGKSPDLTGRTELWSLVAREIGERPIQGWGYFAFWGATNPIANDISASLGWTVPQAHNAILEILLELGVLGITIVVIYFARTVVISWKCMRTFAPELGTSSLICCLAIALNGYTEGVLLDYTSPMTSAFVIFGLLAENSLQFQRRRQFTVVASRRAVSSRSYGTRTAEMTPGRLSPNVPGHVT